VLALLERALGRHGLIVGGLALVAVGVYGGAVFVHPLDADNLVSLSVGTRSDPSDYFTGDAHGFYRPAYRPFAELTLWVQNHLVGLQIHSYFAVNIAIWAAVAMLVYALVVVATDSRVAGAAAAGATLLDPRGILAILWILERQSSLALLLGLTALLLALLPARPAVWISIGLLILCSAMSKEFGLAFAVAVPLLAWLQRRPWRPIALASVGAVVLYVILRLGVAGGATSRFCDEMGYFRRTREVCYDNYGGFGHIGQQAYNVLASLVGTFLPPLFDSFGTIVTPSARSLVVPAIVTALAALAAWQRPRWALPLLSLVVLNAVLNFVLYRTRNQLIGFAALYSTAALGLHWLWLQVAPRAGRWAPAVAVCGAVLVLGWLAQNAVLRPRTVQSFQEIAANSNPCDAQRRFRDVIDPAVVSTLKRRYGVACK
jgi:hypothetical protein